MIRRFVALGRGGKCGHGRQAKPFDLGCCQDGALSAFNWCARKIEWSGRGVANEKVARQIGNLMRPGHLLPEQPF